MTFRIGPPFRALALLFALGAGMSVCVSGSRAQQPNVPVPPPRPAVPGAARPLPQIDTQALRGDVQRNEALQAQVRGELEAASGDRGKLARMLVDTTGRIREVEQQLIEVEARMAELDRVGAGIRASLVKRRALLEEVLGALVRLGRNPPPPLLMRPDDALDAVRSAILLGAILPEMRVEAETLAADLSELARVRSELSTARDRLEALRRALDEDRARISALVAERQRRQAEANPVQTGERAQAEALAKSTGDVHDLVTRLETEVAPAARAADAARAEAPAPAEGTPAVRTDLAALPNPARLAPAMPFVEAKGLLPLPVAGVRLRDFGAPDGFGGSEKGLTLATRVGAQVAAPCDGWVVYAGPFRSYGQLLIINGGGGYHVLMAGMDRITVELGQFVLAGEPVAVMGGGSRGANAASGQPQLYVEFRKDGISIDPAPWWAATDSQKVRG
ncbi:murein hydrolase activator EnvC family protein [Aquabacter spiritensis]|uniref:Septal ring factor EnvC (AmiA/AmiB activator) n=1 Tax=Aquabacter spiritensis TaxID=933073 RepID=A0A4R3LL68_9HYPH|nr:peptidoglycan DD-metalloendopeptidase family protein [Aquabacter spiritensis]TCT01042.1 septal ring factor EnvC (AmiA/AmiB activator) [Aquabacter spiritensis]